ncbi:MAG: DUF2254 domain-containing protein [Methanomassiliicoccales archaeon]
MKPRSIWDYLKTSFWFIPFLFILIAFVGAYAMIYLDTSIDVDPPGFLRYLFPSSVDSARVVLSTISGAMIGVAGTVFSITLVVLTLASSQFGPRLLRNFMHDRANQVVLGSYVSTFVYCLLVLNSVESGEGVVFVPELSSLVAIIAAVANILLLVLFIHHISMGIQADKVIGDISKALMVNLKTIFPEEIDEDGTRYADVDIEVIKKGYESIQTISSPKDGYLQYVRYDAILSTAVENDLFIVVRYRPGDYIVEGAEFMEIFSHKALPSGTLKKLEMTLKLGNMRTPYQDAEFSIHQMVEIAARALSPSVNDPYTAITCIDNLTSIICQLTSAKFPSPYHFDKEGTVRLAADVLTFDGMINASFNKIRQYSGGSPSVLIRLMESLVTVHHFVRTDQQKQVVQKHIKMVYRNAENSFIEDNDLRDLKDRIKAIVGDS